MIRYGGHSLNRGESHYQAHKLEFLGLKWAVTMVFHEYMFGNHFTVKSYNDPLKNILTMAWLYATDHHWMAQLASYNFTMLYKSEKNQHQGRCPLQDRLGLEIYKGVSEGNPWHCHGWVWSACQKFVPLLQQWSLASRWPVALLDWKLGRLCQISDSCRLGWGPMQDWDLSQVVQLYKVRQLDMAKLCDFECRVVTLKLSYITDLSWNTACHSTCPVGWVLYPLWVSS